MDAYRVRDWDPDLDGPAPLMAISQIANFGPRTFWPRAKFPILVAESDGRIVAYLEGEVDIWERPGRWRIAYVVFDPAYRGVGVGRLLVDQWIVRAAAGRMTEVVLESAPTVAGRRARASFFRACGFHPYREAGRRCWIRHLGSDSQVS